MAGRQAPHELTRLEARQADGAAVLIVGRRGLWAVDELLDRLDRAQAARLALEVGDGGSHARPALGRCVGRRGGVRDRHEATRGLRGVYT
eukprot:scaffold35662_cov66-Phaeocystis_antarctica.AAC.2